MSTDASLDHARAVVLSMDIQKGIVSLYVKNDAFVDRVATVLRQARRLQMPVVHVKVAFRPNVPEASPRNMFLSAVRASVPHQRFFQGESGAIHPGIEAQETDLTVTNSRLSAFAGTDLDLLLRAQNIDTVITFGIA